MGALRLSFLEGNLFKSLEGAKEQLKRWQNDNYEYHLFLRRCLGLKVIMPCSLVY